MLSFIRCKAVIAVQSMWAERFYEMLTAAVRCWLYFRGDHVGCHKDM